LKSRYPSTETNLFGTELPALFDRRASIIDRRASIGPHCFVAYSTQALIASAQLKAPPKQWISQLVSMRRMAIPTSSRRRQQLAAT
jgi:hypothetical protein